MCIFRHMESWLFLTLFGIIEVSGMLVSCRLENHLFNVPFICKMRYFYITSLSPPPKLFGFEHCRDIKRYACLVKIYL